MALKEKLDNTRQLKKSTYKILRKMHDLERGRKFQNIYSARINDTGEFYILLCIGHIKKLILDFFDGVTDSETKMLIKNYISHLDSFYGNVNSNSKNNKKIEKFFLANVLLSHTELFNLILKKKLTNETDEDEWNKVRLTVVRIWGNDI